MLAHHDCPFASPFLSPLLELATSFGTLLRCHAPAYPDGVLARRLDEGREDAPNIINIHHPSAVHRKEAHDADDDADDRLLRRLRGL